jgi:hypothetical protein
MPLSSTRRQVLLQALTGAGAASVLTAAANATAASGITASSGIKIPTGGPRDFDFFVGHWHGKNRRLKQRWAGSTEWDEFAGDLRCENRLGGAVNIDEVHFPTKGWSGMTVRLFNPKTRQWSLYWIASKSGELFPPVVGGFTGRRGEFYGDDTDDGKPVMVRYLWTVLGPGAADWEQAFSLDGKAWETNWICEHRRVKS